MNIVEKISKELQLKQEQIKTAFALFDDGATVPFIARYRKEHTGGLDEDQLRNIEDRRNYIILLEDRKKTVLASIEEQGKLTGELKEKIIAAEKLREVEDLYLPYKPKRKTRATIAIAKGLEPLAEFILNNLYFKGKLEDEAEKYINIEKEVNTVEEAIQGAKDIIAERISENADVRQLARDFLLENSKIVSKKVNLKKEELDKNKKDVYEIYYEFEIEIKKIKPYQVLAINRGEKEKFLKVILSYDHPKIVNEIYDKFFGTGKNVFEDMLRDVTEDSFSRLIFPSIERDVRSELTEKADLHAVEIFASNLRQLLLQPPFTNKMIMGIDPGFVSGCKVAVIDHTGKYLEGDTIYPHPPQKRINQAKQTVLQLIKKYKVELISIGNGTASRETESMIADLITDNKLQCYYLITNEAGASVYSASKIAKEEFPDLDASQRGNISIARRVQDPLAELVKIDSKSIGVGLYQHDVDQKLLNKKLDDVVVSCVNYVGVDVNTASSSLLNYVSGLTKNTATKIVEYRDKNGKFTTRDQIKNVKGIGEKVFEQSIGFLKIPNGENPLDNTFIHPESYPAVEKLLSMTNIDTKEIYKKGSMLDLFIKQKSLDEIAKEIEIGIPTLEDILENLKKPGRDPREDMPKPILRSDVLKIEDLEEGMKLKGTVRNVVDFGAFVDIGVKQDGLLHISQIANKFIKHPIEVLNVGDIIDVTIISVDQERGRISLSLLT